MIGAIDGGLAARRGSSVEVVQLIALWTHAGYSRRLLDLAT